MVLPELDGRYLDVSSIVQKKLDVHYGPCHEQLLDVYYPEADARAYPVVVFFHGGGFFKGNKRRYQLLVALQALARGYAVASVGYRLAPQSLLPAAYEDATLALEWLGAHASALGLDARRMCVWGESAGASLAVVAGYTCRVRAVVDWYAPLDIGSVSDEVFGAEDDPGMSNADYVCGEKVASICEDTNLLRVVGPGVPPTFIEHGLADNIVDWHDSQRLYDEVKPWLDEQDIRLVLVEDAQHGVADFANDENIASVLDFIDRHMDV